MTNAIRMVVEFRDNDGREYTWCVIGPSEVVSHDTKANIPFRTMTDPVHITSLKVVVEDVENAPSA